MTVKTMDPDEKKRIANEKRLNAVRLWKKNNTVKNVQKKNTHVVFEENHSAGSSAGSSKPKLFDSDEEDETFEASFKKRPQFDGPRGQKLLEMSSQFSERFKLDERFLEDEVEEEQIETQNNEASKNIQILQSVLGYSISSKSAEKSLLRKRQVRFDPEDENASKYIKVSEKPPESKKAKKKKGTKLDQFNEEPSIPISTERYIEVSSNLKEILSEPVEQFSLSQKFDETTNRDFLGELNGETNYDLYETKLIEPAEKKVEEKKEIQLNFRDTASNSKRESFFIREGDPKLKEGIEFFKRPKPLEDIRKEWNEKRERVLEVFRRRKRSMDRSSTSRANSSRTNHFSRKQKF